MSKLITKLKSWLYASRKDKITAVFSTFSNENNEKYYVDYLVNGKFFHYKSFDNFDEANNQYQKIKNGNIHSKWSV